MRIQITFQVSELPVSYRFVILSYLKEALKQGDNLYFERLYEGSRGRMKPFSYSVFLKNFVFKEEKIELSEMSITVSSPDNEFMLHLFNGVQALRTYQAGDYTWERISIRMLKEWELTGETIYCRTLSPILIENKEGKPVHPHDDFYKDEFQYYARLRVKELIGRELYKPLLIEPINMRKVVVKEVNSTFREHDPGQKHLTYTAYRGQLRLIGHPEDLQLLYQVGVGKRASQGYGLLEIEREG